jgi:hypothetical protein
MESTWNVAEAASDPNQQNRERSIISLESSALHRLIYLGEVCYVLSRIKYTLT